MLSRQYLLLCHPDLNFFADNVTIYFLKDILARKKSYVRNEAIQTVYVPQYEGLYLKDIAEFASQHPNIAAYMPDEPDLPKTPKQWIINVCATVIGKPFKTWVKDQVEECNETMNKKKQMDIDMDPQMHAKFQASTHVSRKYFHSLECLWQQTSALISLFLNSNEGRVPQHAQDLQQAQTNQKGDPGGE